MVHSRLSPQWPISWAEKWQELFVLDVLELSRLDGKNGRDGQPQFAIITANNERTANSHFLQLTCQTSDLSG